MAKFTFKTEKQTGRYKSFFTPWHYIKLNGKQVGSIEHKSWRIRLMVYDEKLENTNCKWKWITLKKEPTSLQDAKDWLLNSQKTIEEKYKLHKLED